jgi:cell division septal protein FtsQ
VSGAEKPSRRKPSATARFRRFWIAFAFVLILAAAGAYFAVTWPALYPHRILVIGNHVVGEDQILNAAAIDPQRNLWLQNSRAIAARVEAIPFIDRVWLHRRLPADATIVVTERVPFAVVHAGGAMFLVDRTLRVLTLVHTQTKLPTIDAKLRTAFVPGEAIRDRNVLALGADLQALAAAGIVDLRAVGFDRYGGLIATRRDGIQLLLGDDDDLPHKLALVGPIEKQTAGGRPLRAIDLRTPATPVIVYRTP